MLKSPRFAALSAYLLAGSAVGWFLWEGLTSESVNAALLGPGLFAALPKPGIEVCAPLGWAVVAVLAVVWSKLGTGFRPCLPLLLLGAIAIPGAESLAPCLVILALSGTTELTVLMAQPRGDTPSAPPESQRRWAWLAWGMAAAYFVVFSAMSLLQYAALNVSDTDTTSFDRMLWFTLQGRVLWTGEACFFGDHVQPILFVLLPFYWIWPGLNVLMLLQTAALASGAPAIYALARRRLSEELALASAAAYVLYPAMQFVNLEGTFNTFRPISFAVPLLLWALVCLETGRLRLWTVCLVGALCCKEEFGLVAFTFGLYAGLKHRRWRWGGGMAALGLLWFVVSVSLVIPHFRGGALRYMPHYSHLGATPAEVLKRVALHPIDTLAQLPWGEELRFLLALLSPLALLPLLGWECLLIAAPTFAYSLLSNRPAQRSIWFHYHAPIVPFCVAAAVFGAERLAKWWPQDQVRRAIMALVLSAAVLGSIFLSKSPLSIAFWNPRGSQSYRLYRPTDKSRSVRRLRALIPPTAPLEASNFLSAHFTHRQHLFRYPKPEANADYVLVDLGERWLDRNAAMADLGGRVEGGRYVVKFQKEGIVLLRREERTFQHSSIPTFNVQVKGRKANQ